MPPLWRRATDQKVSSPSLISRKVRNLIALVSYNPEDDLHYATLTVRDTLLFALKTRTPDKASRIPGESRKDYQQTFLSAIAKLFWIEHALGTKVGNELIRGVSGG
jgi:ABC-type multidrug transport system ATPase subunit